MYYNKLIRLIRCNYLKITTRNLSEIGENLKNPILLSKQIYNKIQLKGPISVADYMKEVLTNPNTGYYMNKDVFGESGDFVTSPEISQMFGEMIAVWLINEWKKMGAPKPFQIVELGPGRGSLASDILKVFKHFNVGQNALQLVEVSPYLSEMQAEKLCVKNSIKSSGKSSIYKTGRTMDGVPVNWFKSLIDVPNTFSLFIAHEFFDALPVHKFQLTDNGYKEVLIDVVPNSNEDNPQFRYILARNPTPIQNVLINLKEKRHHLEISPDCMIICKNMCERVKIDGGVALICDYGHDGLDSDSFRAFKRHKQVHPLIDPGSSDLTADVDFSVIKKVANEVGGVLTFGPVTQRNFLIKTGLDVRVKNLKETIKDEKMIKNIMECYGFLTNVNQMGERFKFMALLPETMKKILNIYPVVGFN